MKTTVIRTAAVALAMGGVLSAGTALAQQSQQVQARVVSAVPITEVGGRTSYNVTYEYAGRQYTTRTDTPPGPTLVVETNAYGVATMPVAPQNPVEQTQDTRGGWQNVVPEPGVVVSSGPAPSPNVYYTQPAPVYVQPAYPAYTYAAPYPAPYPYYAPAFPPIGLSLNLGYSRGWRGHRGWR